MQNKQQSVGGGRLARVNTVLEHHTKRTRAPCFAHVRSYQTKTGAPSGKAVSSFIDPGMADKVRFVSDFEDPLLLEAFTPGTLKVKKGTSTVDNTSPRARCSLVLYFRSINMIGNHTRLVPSLLNVMTNHTNLGRINASGIE